MRILALEPYCGGSHRAFLDGWSAASRHQLTVLGLPAHSWKWRMRHAPLTLAERVAELESAGEAWDLLWASDMLDLAQWRGLALRRAPRAARLPAVVYFHENQLNYPVRREDERDLHFALTNLATALAADEVWFNSAYHRASFRDALPGLLARFPDHRPEGAPEAIAGRSRVEPPGIAPPAREIADERRPGPLRVVWAARWEHDKAPQVLFGALGRLRRKGVPFRVSVLGERFREVPGCFADAERELAGSIDHWGYLPDRADYEAVLAAADVIVSTARHEFFGLAVVEAVAAGALPLLPRRLSYPELFGGLAERLDVPLFRNGGADALAAQLAEAVERLERGALWAPFDAGAGRRLAREAAGPFLWPRRAPELDRAAEEVVERVGQCAAGSRTGGEAAPASVRR